MAVSVEDAFYNVIKQQVRTPVLDEIGVRQQVKSSRVWQLVYLKILSWTTKEVLQLDIKKRHNPHQKKKLVL